MEPEGSSLCSKSLPPLPQSTAYTCKHIHSWAAYIIWDKKCFVPTDFILPLPYVSRTCVTQLGQTNYTSPSINPDTYLVTLGTATAGHADAGLNLYDDG